MIELASYRVWNNAGRCAILQAARKVQESCCTCCLSRESSRWEVTNYSEILMPSVATVFKIEYCRHKPAREEKGQYFSLVIFLCLVVLEAFKFFVCKVLHLWQGRARVERN